ncbi:MAG: hypothetical protein ACREB7_13285 [Sphingopyxis sp.]|uniref:hypothetical protein n=1 Tax=Sphingopyxis sp. TaxID=1908224 RepID=UPI003D6D3C5D
MKRLTMLLSLFVALAIPAVAQAADAKAPDELVEIDGKKPVVIKPDRAYLLFRVKGKWFAPVFMRVPTEAEVAAYYAAKKAAFDKALPDLKKARDAALAKQAAAKGTKSDDEVPPEPSLETFDYHHPDVQNLQSINLGKALEKGKDEKLMLIEAVPGSYVIYGAGNQNAMLACMCLGSVGFEAKAGEVTDLGAVHVAIAWQASDDPVLAGETGLGASVNGHWVMPAMGVAPATAPSAPAALAGKPVVTASWRAIGKFVGPPVFNVNRLAPVAGVLSYDARGRVIDVKSGEPVADNY